MSKRKVLTTASHAAPGKKAKLLAATPRRVTPSAQPFWSPRAKAWSAQLPFGLTMPSRRAPSMTKAGTVTRVRKATHPVPLPPNLATIVRANAAPFEGTDAVSAATPTTNKPNLTVRIRLKPNKEESKRLNKCIRAARLSFNMALDFYVENKDKPIPVKLAKVKVKGAKDGDEKKTEERSVSWCTRFAMHCVNRNSTMIAQYPSLQWLLTVPSDERRDATKDVVRAMESNRAKQAKGSLHKKFRLKYRSKHDAAQSIVVRARNYNFANGAFAWLRDVRCQNWARLSHLLPSLADEKRDTKTPRMPRKIPHDARLVRKRTGEWFLCIPTNYHQRRPREAEVENKIISLDPGVRTFMTGHDPAGAQYEWGAGVMTRCSRVLQLAYKLRTLAAATKPASSPMSDEDDDDAPELEAKAPTTRAAQPAAAVKPQQRLSLAHRRNRRPKQHPKRRRRRRRKLKPIRTKTRTEAQQLRRRRYRLSRKALRLEKKARNLVTNVHCQLASHLCQNFGVVLLPRFNTAQMVEKRDKDGNWKRKIGPKTAKLLSICRHFDFRQRLLQKAREYGTNIVVCDEAYTSKTCGRCGHLNLALGAAKIFHCPSPSCGYRIDRDRNAARQILVRFLTLRGGDAPIVA